MDGERYDIVEPDMLFGFSLFDVRLKNRNDIGKLTHSGQIEVKIGNNKFSRKSKLIPNGIEIEVALGKSNKSISVSKTFLHLENGYSEGALRNFIVVRKLVVDMLNRNDHPGRSQWLLNVDELNLGMINGLLLDKKPYITDRSTRLGMQTNDLGSWFYACLLNRAKNHGTNALERISPRQIMTVLTFLLFTSSEEYKYRDAIVTVEKWIVNDTCWDCMFKNMEFETEVSFEPIFFNSNNLRVRAENLTMCVLEHGNNNIYYEHPVKGMLFVVERISSHTAIVANRFVEMRMNSETNIRSLYCDISLAVCLLHLFRSVYKVIRAHIHGHSFLINPLVIREAKLAVTRHVKINSEGQITTGKPQRDYVVEGFMLNLLDLGVSKKNLKLFQGVNVNSELNDKIITYCCDSTSTLDCRREFEAFRKRYLV